jgi:hypothetical protein
MYWRSKPEMSASVSAPDWPRNGAKLKARPEGGRGSLELEG